MVKAVAAPKAPLNFQILGLSVAAVFALLASWQLLRLEKFIPELSNFMGSAEGIATSLAVILAACQILALPFLLRMPLSLLGRMVSAICVLLVPLLYLVIIFSATIARPELLGAPFIAMTALVTIGMVVSVASFYGLKAPQAFGARPPRSK